MKSRAPRVEYQKNTKRGEAEKNWYLELKNDRDFLHRSLIVSFSRNQVLFLEELVFIIRLAMKCENKASCQIRK